MISLTSCLMWLVINDFRRIRRERITPEGFFNLSLLQPLQILGLGSYLRNFRGDQTHEQLAKLLDISQSSLSKYENELQAIPFSIFQKMIVGGSNSQIALQVLYSLNLNEKIFFRSARTPPIKLPLKLTPIVEEVMSQISPKARSVIIKSDNEELKKRKKILE